MSQIVVVPLKRKMLLWMSDVEMKDGVDAYFFRAINRIVTDMHKTRLTGNPSSHIIASDCNGKGDQPWEENKNIPSTPPSRSVL